MRNINGAGQIMGIAKLSQEQFSGYNLRRRIKGMLSK